MVFAILSKDCKLALFGNFNNANLEKHPLVVERLDKIKMQTLMWHIEKTFHSRFPFSQSFVHWSKKLCTLHTSRYGKCVNICSKISVKTLNL